MEQVESIGSALHINDRGLGSLERWASLATATAVMAYGSSRRSVPGMPGGRGDAVGLSQFPLGAAFAKGLTLKMGQTEMHQYLPLLLERIERGEIDPSFIITHRVTLDDAPTMYDTFRERQGGCIKVVMKPGERAASPTARSH